MISLQSKTGDWRSNVNLLNIIKFIIQDVAKSTFISHNNNNNNNKFAIFICGKQLKLPNRKISKWQSGWGQEESESNIKAFHLIGGFGLYNIY